MPYKTISKLHIIAPIISLGLPFELPYQNWPTLIESGRDEKLVLPCQDRLHECGGGGLDVGQQHVIFRQRLGIEVRRVG